MKNGIVDKLSTYAALIGVIATIGGGFMLGANLIQDYQQ